MSELIALLTGEARNFLPRGVITVKHEFDRDRQDDDETVERLSSRELAKGYVRREKYCATCQKVHPIEDFDFWLDSKNGKSYPRSTCRKVLNAQRSLRRKMKLASENACA